MHDFLKKKLLKFETLVSKKEKFHCKLRKEWEESKIIFSVADMEVKICFDHEHFMNGEDPRIETRSKDGCLRLENITFQNFNQIKGFCREVIKEIEKLERIEK